MTTKPTNVTYTATDENNLYASSVQWIIDSGASDIMKGNIDLLEEYSESSLPASIKIAEFSLTTVKGSGFVTLNKNLLLHNAQGSKRVIGSARLGKGLYTLGEISQPSICQEPDLNPVAAEIEGNNGYQEATNVDFDGFPIVIRKGVRKCTAHPINKYVAYGKLLYNFRAFTASINSVKIPRNVTEAFLSPEWEKVVEEEIKALQKNKT
ncbi:uncharacterized protein LOC120182499 [Hibiscus syriacus]|uniref:uncharacterized protein LOC120182499 n=1 Tax=Hibiscus syriacus TaxID=106335 RepID=UPI001921BB4A|nr:uncharacterized protein LOC120182499 [Hibiscus syriacus]